MSYVYFAKFGRHVKIGFASNPAHRLEQVRRPYDAASQPDDFDYTAPGELIHLVPGCRMRDERNMQLLFANHWSGTGEWFIWSPAFRYQMETMQFVTHAERLMYLRRARRELGLTPGGAVKEERWGKQTHDFLVEARERMLAAAKSSKRAA